ncbi:AraC family transcriptional regulator [Rhodoferax saidenbachensis]|uniref:AraC-like DNA-binding protein n=1 Tax=Rhodoferax saidenbachensis TaxID=1484693 RepID=A0ABU1ZR87_9BURK|nr:AraC family transcriptional regulator [Rhodoferax saidenbachensis]MDR7307066.1 AraC-like DNA-binding protein [Rhodoferax saidenbachensis]
MVATHHLHSQQGSQPNRRRAPELEADYNRNPLLGYEPTDEVGFIRCLDHGYPTPLARWHCHDEYELHLITATSGKAFVGDWIGPFEPGHLVLCGPRLPHNWISLDLPDEGVLRRDLVIQFRHEPLEQACHAIPEFSEVLPLLERARHGIEFFGMAETAASHWHVVKSSRGLKRVAAFCDLASDLARCTDYRLLSNVQMRGVENDAELDQINTIVNRITENPSHSQTAAEVAAELAMSESRFSRFFRRATGNTYTDFVNRVRINRACQLLMSSDRYVTNICYDVGFNNVANFNRRFLELKGMTPSEFRKQAESRFGGAPAHAAAA